MGDDIGRAEVTLIAQEAADKAIEKHHKQLPLLLKPVMTEVAETVAHRQRQDYHHMIGRVFGADIDNADHVREVNKDLFHLRDLRIAAEHIKKTAREAIIRTVAKMAGSTLITVLGAVAIIIGFR